jgi:hypothetical protein
MNTTNANVSRAESFRRIALGFFILAVFFANPSLPAWVSLISLYPLATALLQWDPIVAVFESVIRAINLRRIKQAAEKISMRSSAVKA